MVSRYVVYLCDDLDGDILETGSLRRIFLARESRDYDDVPTFILIERKDGVPMGVTMPE